MKVQLTGRELRDVLRQIHTCRDDTVMLGEVEMEVLADECKARDQQSEPLSPEEQIRRHPELALDTQEPPPSHEEKVTELLRWLHRPKDARGMQFDVPHGHPSGLGGQKIYVPELWPVV